MTNPRAVLAVVIGMLAIPFDRAVLGLLPIPQSLIDTDYMFASLTYVFDIGLMIVLLRVVGGVALARQWDVVGLHRIDRSVLVWALLLFAPPALLMLATSPVSPDATLGEIAFKGLVFPMAEEIGYRGQATGILLFVCAWRFLPAALLPALFFGLAHAAQGSDLSEAGMLTAITGAGGLLFGWLYWKWDGSLWPPFFLHAGLNTIWSLFDLGENAVGGWLGNALRLAVVAASIALTLWGRTWLARISGSRR